MSGSIRYFVAGEPKGQPRPRACIRGNRAAVYDPGTADGWKWAVRAATAEHRGQGVLGGPVRLVLRFLMPRPKAHFRTGRHSAELKPEAPDHHQAKPDLDNLEKAVMDAMTAAGIWLDDSQVTSKDSRKLYAPPGTGPGCWIEVVEAAEARAVA